jgi:hypothetical protein
VPVSDQDHGHVPLAPAIGPGGISQPLDLGISQYSLERRSAFDRRLV